jgi:hypothetical protein
MSWSYLVGQSTVVRGFMFIALGCGSRLDSSLCRVFRRGPSLTSLGFVVWWWCCGLSGAYFLAEFVNGGPSTRERRA